MTTELWRFLDSGFLPGAHNMAVDEALLEAYLAGETPPTLRVYGWRPPAVSVGRFQRVDASLDLEACRRLGVDVVRRPTGGRAILHTADEVTFSIVVPAARLGATGVMDAYRALAAGIIAALRSLGLDPRLVERGAPAGPASVGPAPVGPAPALDPACFAVKARCDLVVGSAKVVGSAQVQRRGVVLQQNSLPLRLRPADWEPIFRRAARPPDAAGLCDVAGRPIGCGEVAAALRDGFAAAFGIRFADAPLAERELSRARDLAPRAAVLSG